MIAAAVGSQGDSGPALGLGITQEGSSLTETPVSETQEKLIDGVLSPVLFVDHSDFTMNSIQRLLGDNLDQDWLVNEEGNAWQMRNLGNISPETLIEMGDNALRTMIFAMVRDLWKGHSNITRKAFLDRVNLGNIDDIPISSMDEAFEKVDITDGTLGVLMKSAINAEKIGDVIQEQDDKNNKNGRLGCKIVNMSFQVGTGAFLTQMKSKGSYPILQPKIIDGKSYYAPQGYSVEMEIKSDGTRGQIVKDLEGNITGITPWTEEQYRAQAEQYMRENIKPSEYVDFNVLEPWGPLVDEAQQRQNLLDLIGLCNRFPDKLFISSAGNANSDFEALRDSLEQENIWLSNLLLAGFVQKVEGLSNDFTTSSGADVYTHEYGSSSEAAANLTGVGAMIEAMYPSLSPTEVRDEIMKLTKDFEYARYRLVFNLQGGSDISEEEGLIFLPEDAFEIVGRSEKSLDPNIVDTFTQQFLEWKQSIEESS